MAKHKPPYHIVFRVRNIIQIFPVLTSTMIVDTSKQTSKTHYLAYYFWINLGIKFVKAPQINSMLSA